MNSKVSTKRRNSTEVEKPPVRTRTSTPAAAPGPNGCLADTLASFKSERYFGSDAQAVLLEGKIDVMAYPRYLKTSMLPIAFTPAA